MQVLSAEARAAEVTRYYHMDAIGNVRAVTDESGTVVERHDYLPFGEELCGTQVCSAVTAGQPMRFTGKERDAETGWDYFGARYYGSKIGRFTTVDPYLDTTAALFNPQRWNRYAYGLNNPLRYVDPDGRDVWDTMAGWANAVGSNAFLGLGRGNAYNSDYASGQAMGDKFSLGLSVVEMDLAIGGGAVLALPSGGTVAIPAAALAGHSVAQAGAATFNLSKNNAQTSGGKPHPKKGRSLEGAEDQLESIERQQAAQRKAGRDTIDSTKKSEQNLKAELKKIMSSEDVKSQE